MITVTETLKMNHLRMQVNVQHHPILSTQMVPVQLRRDPTSWQIKWKNLKRNFFKH